MAARMEPSSPSGLSWRAGVEQLLVALNVAASRAMVNSGVAELQRVVDDARAAFAVERAIAGGAFEEVDRRLLALASAVEACSAGQSTGRAGAPVKAAEVTKEDLLQILSEIVTAQEVADVSMTKITKELMNKPGAFADAYAKVKEVQPDDVLERDVLERYNLSMPEFDEMLSKHSEDERVMQGMMKLEGAPDMNSAAQAKDATPKQVVDVHKMVLEGLKEAAEHVRSTRAGASCDMKAVRRTVRAIVAAKVEEEFGLTLEDVEDAAAKHHASLATNQEFTSVSTKMQDVVFQLGLQ